MKSRNLKAIFASVLTVALLATAVTGFAAQNATVATTTTYNTVDNKVAVTTTVTNATGNSEVTYLVKSGSGIVYIDQDTADESGRVDFVYKIAKNKMDGYSSAVTFGTNAGDSFAGTGRDDLGIVALKKQSGDHYTVTYEGDAVAAGIGEMVTAYIEPHEGYEITSIMVGETSYPADTASVLVDNDDVITVETKEAEKAPAISVYKVLGTITDEEDDNYGKEAFTAVIIPEGNVEEFGVEYALFGNVAKQYRSLTADKMAAVQLILPENKQASIDDFKPYFVVNGELKYEFTPVE